MYVYGVQESYGQNRSSIRGNVYSSIDKKPVNLATVALVAAKDSSLFSYTLSSKEGQFTLHDIPMNTQFKIVVSYLGGIYRNNQIITTREPFILDSIFLEPKSLREVVISGQNPVTVRNDTIEFVAEAFKTRPNAVVEELLKNLPGIQVEANGTILMNGVKVSKITLEGKDYFTNDLSIASKNLQANIVEKIQVFDDREKDPNHLIEASKVQKIINLTLKSNVKKSLFGKIYAGGGTDRRYEAGGLLNLFRDTLQVSLIGFGNNINSSAFTNEDLNSLGGFDRSGQNLFDGSLSFGGNYSNGRQRINSGGVNINYDVKKKLKLNLLYTNTATRNTFSQRRFSKQFFSDTTLVNNSSTEQIQAIYDNNISGTVKWNVDALSYLNYSPTIKFNSSNIDERNSGRVGSNFVQLINENSGVSTQKSDQVNFGHNLYYFHKYNSGASLTITNNLKLNNISNSRTSDNTLYSFINPVGPNSVRQLTYSKSKTSFGDINITYRQPLSKKVVAELTAGSSISNNDDYLQIVNETTQSGLFNIGGNRTSDIERLLTTNSLKSSLTWNPKNAISAIIGVTLQDQKITDTYSSNQIQNKQQLFNLLPSARVTVKDFILTYDRSISVPTAFDLQTTPIIVSPLLINTGNPNLRPTFSNNLNLSYYKYNREKKLSINGSISANFIEDAIVKRQVVDENGSTITSPFNKDGYRNIYYRLDVRKTFKRKNGLQAGYSVVFSGNISKSYFEVNNVKGWQYYYDIGPSGTLYLNYKSIIDFNTTYRFRQYVTSYDQTYADNSYTFYYINNALIIHLTKRLSFENNYVYTLNTQLNPGIRKYNNLINSSVNFQIGKEKNSEVKLSVFDLLNQNQSIYRSVTGNSVIDYQNEILKRYFMVTYVHRFSLTNAKR